MPVTIRILSGARQGDEILLDAREFRIGDGPECEVCFDPQADPAAQGRLAKIRLKDDGWYVRPDASGAMLLNRSTIAGETHLRSGDVLRMSPTGPDVLFAISAIAPSSATTAAAEIPRPVERKPADVPRSAPAVTGNQETLTVSASSASSTPAPDSGPAPSRRRTWAALAVSAALLVASAWWVFASGRHGVGPAAQSAQAEPDAGPASDRTAAEGGSPPVLNVPAELALKAGEETVFSVSAVIPGRPASRPTLRADGAPDWVKIDADSGTIHCTPPATANGTFELKISAIDKDQPSLVTQAVVKLQVSGDPWTRVQEELGEAVFLVLVEAGNEETARTWPFATCSAIGDSTLLTTARETAQLAVWRGQGFRIWVSRSTDGPRIEVKDLRVHRQFVPLADKPGDWVYANLGLLVTEEKLPRAARLASTDELRELEEGLPLACFGFSHDGGKITRFRTIEPRLYRGEVYLVSGPLAADSPLRLLEIKAEIPENVYGSPIVDSQGRVVAVYGEAAPPEAVPVKNLHYAAVLDSELLRSWLAQNESGWVPPPLEANQAQSGKSPSP